MHGPPAAHLLWEPGGNVHLAPVYDCGRLGTMVLVLKEPPLQIRRIKAQMLCRNSYKRTQF